MVTRPRNRSAVLCPQQLAVAMGAVSRGDSAAFAKVYAATSAKLYGIVLRIVRRRDVADELLQDIYFRIWQCAGQFDELRSSPITWMATIARNHALDEVKRKSSLFEDGSELLELAAEDIQYERAEDAYRLQACLERLGPEKSSLVVQAYCYGMTRKEIARVTGRPVSTIKTWLRRTLAELRSHIDDDAQVVGTTKPPLCTGPRAAGASVPR